MRKQLGACLLAILLSATGGFAQFEGEVAMDMTWVAKGGAELGRGTIKLAISKPGMRGEINFQQAGGTGLNRVVLCRTDTPNVNYLIKDAGTTYTAIYLSKPGADENSRPTRPKWTVEKLGRKKLLGYQTQHVVARRTGCSMELWVATDFLDFETYQRLQAGPGGGMGGDGGLNAALKAAGAEGMPLKVVLSTEAGDKLTMEAVKAEKKSLPASLFEIPDGYAQSSGK